MNRKKRERLILDASVKVFSKKAYLNTSVADIIKEASVARGTFYLYFKSKKDLFNTLIDRYLSELSQDVSKITAFNMTHDVDLQKKFRTLASDLISSITRNRLLTKIILVSSHGLEQEFDAKINQFYDQIKRIIQYNLDQQINANILRNCNSEIASTCIVGSVKEFIVNWIQSDQIELESQINDLIDYLLNGLSPSLSSSESQDLNKLLSSDAGNFH